MHRSFLILGNGPAAYGAALGWRSAGGKALPSIVAPNWPAPSVPGMTQVVLGHVPPRGADWKAARDWPAEVFTGTAESVDVLGRQVVWRDGFGQKVVCRFEQMVVATGTVPRQLDLPKAFAGEVLHFHSPQDMNAWARLSPGTRVVVVGGGLVGAEMVEMAVSQSCDVHWVMRERRIWPTQLSPGASALLLTEAQLHGVKVHASVEDVAGFAVGLAPEVLGMAVGAKAHSPAGASPVSGIVAHAGDAFGGPMGWAVAMRHGEAIGRHLAQNKGDAPPQPSASGIPFQASFFRQKVSAFGMTDLGRCAHPRMWETPVNQRYFCALIADADQCVGVVTMGLVMKGADLLHRLDQGWPVEEARAQIGDCVVNFSHIKLTEQLQEQSEWH